MAKLVVKFDERVPANTGYAEVTIDACRITPSEIDNPA
jgi:hypothetical protein